MVLMDLFLYTGKSNLVDIANGAEKLYRTDFFPGLGWMLTKNVWMELSPKVGNVTLN